MNRAWAGALDGVGAGALDGARARVSAEAMALNEAGTRAGARAGVAARVGDRAGDGARIVCPGFTSFASAAGDF